MKIQDIQKLARKKLKKLDKGRKDPRFREVIGKLVYVKLMDHQSIPPFNGPVTLEDALWAGELEPRVLELLPAILLKKPKVFTVKKKNPQDLKEVIQCIRKNKQCPDFRGIAAKDYLKWINKIGHLNKKPTLLKTYRFNHEDLKLIDDLKKKRKTTEIAIVREALQYYKNSLDH